MNSIDALNASLNFNVAASVSAQTQKTKEKDKTSKGKAVSFSSALEKEIAVNELNEAGLPLEILGLSQEKAVEYLQDQIDLSADRLDENFSTENFAGFRKSVSQFMRYLEKNNFEVTKLKRPGKPRTVRGLSPFFSEKRPRDPLFQVHVIDEKLDNLARMLLEKHESKLAMLSRVDEIKGLIVDFFAS